MRNTACLLLGKDLTQISLTNLYFNLENKSTYKAMLPL